MTENLYSEVITIGDEVLLGRTVNDNAAFLGRVLADVGIPARWSSTISDDMQEIQAAIALAMNRAHVIITTGGLGPTSDDLTREAICGLFELTLEENPEQREHVENLFRARGQEMPLQSRNQILTPSGTARIPNPIGTAAGIFYSKNNRMLFALPGVPSEMERMMIQRVIPMITERFPGARVFNKTVRLAGIGESQLMARLGDLSEFERKVAFAYLPNHGLLDLRITARTKDQYEADADISSAEAYIREKVGEHVYVTGSENLSGVIGDILVNRSQKLAVAESCTGGLIATMYTDVPGSSSSFERGWVTYSNESKIQNLGVEKSLIEKHGAVSEEVARAMAEGARIKANTVWGISATGVAGPDGGSDDKPVGTVWIAVASENKTTAKKLTLGQDDRKLIKLRTAHQLLYMLYRRLMDEPA